jgi:hypothetical protein
MAINEKLTQLVDAVYEKTKSGELVWETTSVPFKFQVSFAKYSVTILSQGAGATRLELHNDQGALIEEVSPSDTSAAQDAILYRLYELARRQALGVDEAIDELLTELSKPKRK